MPPELKSKFLDYENLKLKEKEIKEKLEVLKVELVPHIPENTVVKGERGSFTLKRRDNYTYTEATEQKMIDLKERQKEEIAKGEATSEPTLFIEWRADQDE